MKYSLNEISSLTGGVLTGADGIVGSVFIDSRTTVPGDMFIAVTGKNHDGHDYIAELYGRGVRAFLVERNVDAKRFPEAGFVRVENSVDALQALAADWRSRFRGTVVGITGSNGKTVVKEWIAATTPAGVKLFRSPKSWNSQVGVPLSILMIEGDENVAVIEAGISQPGEMERLARVIKPDVGILTMLGDAHQENFGSLDHKREEKMKLFDGVRLLLKSFEASHANLAEEFNGALVEELWKALGYDVEVAGMPPIAMRLELKEGVNGSVIVDDSYNSDINSLSIALDYLESVAGGRPRTLVLGDILQSGLPDGELYARVGDMVARSGVEAMVAVGERIGRHAFPVPTSYYPSVEAFLDALRRDDVAGRAILIKGNRGSRFERLSHALSSRSHTTVLEVDLNAVVHNLNTLRVPVVRTMSMGACGHSDITNGADARSASRHAANLRTMAMVKASAYGHGAYEIAATMQHQGVDYLAVAFADEGVALRERGITMPIVVLNADSDSFELMAANALEPEIYNFESLAAFAGVLTRHGERNYPVHIKLDTGMHRLGFGEEELARLGDELARHFELIRVGSIFSHLACADDPSMDDFTHGQIAAFERMSVAICKRLPYAPLRHLANSAGAVRFPDARFDMVRLGLGLYGFGADGLRPVSTLRTRVVQVRELEAGDAVGYGCEGVVERPSRVATISIGYADGLDRHLGNGRWRMMLNGVEVPTLGRISMDTCALDVTGVDARVGDEVTVFGPHATVGDMADALGTIPYEVMTGIAPRVKRVYVKE
jgi:alanine racemase